MPFYVRGALCAAVTMLVSLPAQAQSSSLRVNVPVGGYGSPTATGVASAQEEVRKIPGGAAVVPAKEFQDKYALSMKDMLSSVPGVLAQPRWGEESRLSIRGSGLSRSFHLRGITLLQDGIPFTFADGSGDFQEIDPLTLQHVEVYRGGQGLRYGAATLGGAINMVTPTAHTVDYNGLVRAEAGSYGTLRLHAEAAKVFKGFDAFASTTKSLSDGFRAQSDQNTQRFSGNVGVPLGKDAETRFYAAYNDIEQEVPGTVSKQNALNNPSRVPAVNSLNNYARDIHSLRLANRTVFALDNGMTAEIGGYANDKTLYHPIFQVVDQKSLDAGGFGRLKGRYDLGGYGNEFTAGINLGRGVNDAKRFVNVGGNRGALTSDARQLARNLELYGENRFYIRPDVGLITGLQATIADRQYDDNRNAANDADKTYSSLNPKLGVVWNASSQTEVYASVTKSSEAPTYSELVQGAIPGFVPVDMQKAWTAEIGTRGSSGAFSWDVTLYRAWIKDELLNFTVTPDVPASTFNANDTVHQGIELGAGWRASEEISFGGVYTLNDFYFEDDSQFGDNDLAGAPPHQFRFTAKYEKNGFFVEPNVEWVPQAAWVDYANTLKADSYTTLGLNAGYELNDRISVFVDARNLTDEKTIASFSTITDARTAGTEVFYPGDGRSAFAGIKIKF